MGRLELQEVITTWVKRGDAEVRPMGRFVRRYKTQGENMRWHVSGIRKGMGTVEITYTPSSGRLTVLVHDNRRGTWAGQAYKTMSREMQKLGERKVSAIEE
jgi:hypothetical protein